LYTSYNKLTKLEISEELKNSLEVLSYDNNELAEEETNKLAGLGLAKERKNGKPATPITADFLINNDKIKEIDISNETSFAGKLEVKNCSKLTHLTVDNCKLEELVIKNCPNLKHLSFRYNKVGKINLTGLTNLEALYCSNNILEELDLINNKKLKHLVCDNNPLPSLGNLLGSGSPYKLKVNHLKDLESLYCFKCNLTELDISGLTKLKELYCAHNSI